jgi:hypothetical protein
MGQISKTFDRTYLWIKFPLHKLLLNKSTLITSAKLFSWQSLQTFKMWASSSNYKWDNFSFLDVISIKWYSTWPLTFSNSFWASSFSIYNEKTHPSNVGRSHCTLETYSHHFAMQRTWVSLKAWICYLFNCFDDAPPSSLLDPKRVQLCQIVKVDGIWCCSQVPALKGVRGVCWKLWD